MKKVITLEENERLFVKVYHLGYSAQGEGIVLILYKEDSKVLYSVAIDCFEEGTCNMTDEILGKWHLEEKLDLFIWTHPHDDHSVGVEKIIRKYCNSKSIICTADIFRGDDRYSKICKKNIEYLKSLAYRKKVRNKWKINPLAHFPEILDKIVFNGKGEIKELEIQCIAPFAQIGGMYGFGKSRDYNQIGVACVLKIELKNQNINFLFAGDMDHATIEALIGEADDSIPTVYNYIKIPHHGSENAENMIEFLKNDGEIKSEFASTSVFVKQNLPQESVLKKYKTVVEQVGCTSDIKNNNYGIGAICLEYDLESKKVTSSFYGSATIV